MKAIAFRSRKAKGKRLEIKVAQLIRDKGLDPNAKRMPGSGAFEGFKTDLYSTLPYSFEMKNQETVKLWEWWKQALGQATIARPPVLVVGGNFRPILATMDINTFLELLLEVKQLEELLTEERIKNENT